MDFTYLAAQTFGDQELEKELLELFVDQARRVIFSLPTLDFQARNDAVHLLKGSARAVGADEIVAAVASLDTTCSRDNGLDSARYDALTAAFATTDTEIAIYLRTARFYPW